MDLIDLEDETIDAEVMDSLAVTMDNFRVRFVLFAESAYHTHSEMFVVFNFSSCQCLC